MIGKTGRLLEVSSTYKITCYKRYPDMAPLDKAPKQQVFGWFLDVHDLYVQVESNYVVDVNIIYILHVLHVF